MEAVQTLKGISKIEAFALDACLAEIVSGSPGVGFWVGLF